MRELRQLNARKVRVNIEHLVNQVIFQIVEITFRKVLEDVDRSISITLQSMIYVRNYRAMPPSFNGLSR